MWRLCGFVREKQRAHLSSEAQAPGDKLKVGQSVFPGPWVQSNSGLNSEARGGCEAGGPGRTLASAI